MKELVLTILLLGVVTFIKLARPKKKNTSTPTPPIFEQKEQNSPLDEVLEEVFGTKKYAKATYTKVEDKPLSETKDNKVVNREEKEINNSNIDKEESKERDFDFKEAVIYSEILNNPFFER